jgi:hypothetical protein
LPKLRIIDGTNMAETSFGELEKAISALLPQPRFVKFNVDALLRADSATRWANYKTGAEINVLAQQVGQGPALLTSEMRDWEDLNYIEEYPGATLLVPPEPAPQMNSAQPVNVTVNMPESRSEAPVVNVTNDVSPSPVMVTNEVHTPPAMVNIEVPRTKHTVKRDGAGNIVEVIEEPA